MKYRIALVVSAALVLSGLSINFSSGSGNIHFIESNGYLIPYIENASYEMREGYPLTPYFTK
ncbi:MAG TPA: hypothetical protein ENL42_03940, partial [Thermoplasmatales archaeon]|nr:hypothetical protein [Thermoplasmatales archaeon]